MISSVSTLRYFGVMGDGGSHSTSRRGRRGARRGEGRRRGRRDEELTWAQAVSGHSVMEDINTSNSV
jgi:hypothetical protein